ncbi:MAG TPA: hypothetical protein VNJ08_16575 [Bacteriovoracaceae bacterium]|nr:hypothetical protein [Bacteriovoracaceae bacterium]
MKTTMIILSFLFSGLAFSQTSEREFPALVRTESNKPIQDMVRLADLVSDNSFDGKHFKIVKGKEEEAVKFNAHSDLTFRAATTYYHLTRARDYFVNKIKSDYVKNMPKMVIRIDHKSQFSELGHFAHDNLDPQFNNALTIPAGKGFERRGIKPWGMEIWFRPMKRIHLSEINVNDQAAQEYTAMLKQFRNMMHMQTLQRFLAGLMTSVTGASSANPFAMDSLVRTAGTSVIMEAAYHLFDPLTKLVQRKWYWLDTALVPEIIYHEYAHAALSDHLVLSHSTAIIEGMADFFAGQIADSPKLAKHIKKYNTFNGKNAKKKQDYMIQFEMTDYANTDFVFGLLWEMKKVVGEDRGEAFMFELRKKLTTNSTIRGQLVEGLLQTCREKCGSPTNDRLKILKALNARGI